MLFCLGGVSPFGLDEVWFVDVPSSGDRSEMCFFAPLPVFRGLQVQALCGATLSSTHWLSPWTDVPLWDGTWPL